MKKTWVTIGDKPFNNNCQTSIRRRQRKYKTAVNDRKISNFCQYRQDLHRRFRQFSKDQIQKMVKTKLLSIVGRHSPISYSKKYGFKQQWQMFNRQSSQTGYKTSKIYAFLSILRLVVLSSCIWGISTSITFPIQTQNSLWIKILLLIFSCMEMVKYISIFSYLIFTQKIIQLFFIAIAVAYDIALFLCQEGFILSYQSRIVGVFVIAQMYMKLSRIYKSIKNYHISSQYRDGINLFDLFSFLIAITHAFGCILYTTSQLNPNTNWLTKIGIADKPWLQKYIYSLYFSATTLLTVGYGDLSPTNVAEVLAVLLTEFIVNQIGVVLLSMHEKSQRLQKDLGSVENVGKSYRLEPNVIAKMRTEIINNKRLDQDLCIQEENELLNKFSEDLREKIKIQSSMKAIKRSMFMMVNWTGKFQSKVARKLVKQIYKAEEILPQNYGKEKLYILDKGKIDILNQSKINYKSCFQKVLKSLQVNKQSLFAVENVYGYSSVISDRKINLYAVVKQTSICYTITKSQFLQLLAECQQDRQHFHQIKNKIQLSSIPQQIEAPSITNIRQHYRPSTCYLVARSKFQSNPTNVRKVKHLRRSSRLPLTIYQYQECQMGSDMRVRKQKIDRFYRELEDSDYRIQRANSIVELLNDGVQEMNCQFQTMKSYQRYYKKSNIQNVISKIGSTNFVRGLRRKM